MKGKPNRNAYLVRRYGITEVQYAELLKEQHGVCLICHKKPGKRRLVVDHDHVTLRIKGLLCSRDNFALGKFEYSVEVLERLMTYVHAIISDRYLFALNNDQPISPKES